LDRLNSIINYELSIMNLRKILFIVLSVVVFAPFSAKAATLYLDPVSVKSGPDDVFEVQVRVGMELEECVNAAKIVLNFPEDALEVKDFNSGESIFSLWIDKPGAGEMETINKEGKIVFSGGLPGGYCGKIPGDPGDSNILGSVIFTPKKPIIFHKAGINFGEDTELYLNDGRGTIAKIKTQGAQVDIDENKVGVTDDWGRKIVEDKIPPETFVIEISHDSNVADGRYFIVFSANDKQTGIDHYEVLEAKASDVLRSEGRAGLWDRFKKMLGAKQQLAVYEKASSPHVLKDQDLNSVIKVKAVDRAGNERVIEYRNEALEIILGHAGKAVAIWKIAAGIALAFVLVVLIFGIIFKFKK
jgi:hypothetical protein